MPIVTLSDISFELSNGRTLFAHINLSLEPELTALIGPNGIGKTSLARIVSGELSPTAGAVQRNAHVTYFPQRLQPPPVPAEEFLGVDYGWSATGERLLAGLDRRALCPTLSGGEWMRVRLAGALDERFLILDEPTNDLDEDGREALRRFLREYTGGALLISHDRGCLSLCARVLELSSRGLMTFGGGWSKYLEARDHEREGLQSALEIARREREQARERRTDGIARQEKRNRRGAQAAARGGMPRILIGGRKRRAQVTTGKIDASSLARADDAVRAAHRAFAQLKVDPVMYTEIRGREIPAQGLVAEARGLNIRLRDWLYASDLDFCWRGNVRLAIRGPNGSGKSTLLKAIGGAALEMRGELRRGRLATLCLDQRCESLDDGRSILENVREVCATDESTIRNGLARFLFAGDVVHRKVATLSGGERLRAALARGLLGTEKPQLLVLDEPTNNLDLANIEFLERLVREFQGALLVVSHDEVFLENCGVKAELSLTPPRRASGPRKR